MLTNLITVGINVIQTGSDNAMLRQLVARAERFDLGQLFKVFNSFLNCQPLMKMCG